MKKIVSISLLILSIVYLAYQAYLNGTFTSEKFDAKKYKERFDRSQWRDPISKYPISDEELYTYSAYRYMQGENPILISPEVPALGKYLLGIQLLIFNSQRMLSIIPVFLSLFLVFYILYREISFFAASLGVFLTATHSIFIDQLIYAPQLDILQLMFLLLFTMTYVRYIEKNQSLYFIGSGIAMGCFISLKFFLVYYVLINATIALFHFLLKTKMPRIISNLFWLNIMTVIVYTISYLQYFNLGGTFRGFLGVQKWIFTFYQQSQIDTTKLFGNYLSLIFLNKWRVWSEGYPYVAFHLWSLLWPVLFILGVFSVIKLRKEIRKKPLIAFLVSFLVMYNGVLFVVPIFPRYLILLFVPFVILIAIYVGKLLDKKSYENSF